MDGQSELGKSFGNDFHYALGITIIAKPNHEIIRKADEKGLVSPTLLFVSVSWTRLSNFDAFIVFPKNDSIIRRLAFLPWLQRSEVRQLQRYYQDAMTPCRLPAALRFLRLAIPRLHSLSSLLDGRVRRQGLELVIRYLQPEFRRGAKQGSPKFLGTLNDPFAMFQTDAGRTACIRPYSAAAWPLVIKRQRLPRLGLSTLNSMAFGFAMYASRCELLQHHATLASSRWSGSTGRGSHPQGSDERFQSCNLHLIPLSQAFLAQ